MVSKVYSYMILMLSYCLCPLFCMTESIEYTTACTCNASHSNRIAYIYQDQYIPAQYIHTEIARDRMVKQTKAAKATATAMCKLEPNRQLSCQSTGANNGH
jgi:hypothetical protein